MFKAVSLSMSYDGEPLFRGVDFVLGAGERIGLVGPNGAGKSTLLRVLTGAVPPTSGRVEYGPETRLGHFAQQAPDPDATVGDYLAEGLGELSRLARRLRELEAAMAAAPAAAGPQQQVLAEYARTQERWTALDGWSAQAAVDAARDRMGVTKLPDDAPLREISGGEQARLMLARLLVTEPDLLLLDEPTNHLDTEGAAWLADWLAGFRGGVLLVSHDRAFLDRTVHRIFELDGIHPELQVFEGGYTDYRTEKAHRWERLLLDHEAQQKQRLRLEQDIERTAGQARGTEQGTRDDKLRRYAKKVAKKAKSRERRLRQQMDSARWIAEPRTRPALTLAFPGGEEPADPAPTVLTTEQLTLRQNGRTLLTGAELTVRHGDRILLSGPNGTGKTTLLRTLAGLRTPESGRLHLPPAGAALLPQTHDELRTARDAEGRPRTVLEFFRTHIPVYIEDAELLLSGHHFDELDRAAPLPTLSAGELRRLLLAVMVNSPARLLLLDEPTNYLDFDSLDVVEAALNAYRGTVLTVTHDSRFATNTGHTRHWRLQNGGLQEETMPMLPESDRP